MGAVPAIAFGSGLVLKGSDDAYAGLRQILGERDAVPYGEQGVTYVVGEELATPVTIAVDTITGNPKNLLKNASEDVALGAAQRSAKGVSSNTGKTYKVRISGKSGKEAAKDIPSWARGQIPFNGESGNEFAKRLLDAKYGSGNYPMGSGSEYNKIKKYADRGFRNSE